MNEPKKNMIDDYFREGLENFNIPPPAEVWDKIADQLDGKGKNRKMIVWIAIAATVTLFAAVSGLLYFQGSSHKALNKSELVFAPAKKQVSPANSLPVVISDKHSREIQNTTSGEITLAPSGKKPEASTIASTNNSSQTISGLMTGKRDSVTNPGRKTMSIAPQISYLDTSVHYLSEKKDNPDNYKPTAIALNQLPTISETPVLIIAHPVVKIDSFPGLDFMAQEDLTQEKSIKKRWSIGGQMAPLYSYRNISAIDAPGISKASIDKMDKAAFTYSGGVMIDYTASGRLSFQMGICYMEMGQEENDVLSFSGSTTKSMAYLNATPQSNPKASGVLNSIGTIKTSSGINLYQTGSSTSDGNTYAPGNLALRPADNSTKYNIKQAFEFIEVPFIAKYKVIDRKIGLHLLGGMSSHVLVGSRTDITTNDNTKETGTTSDLKTMNYSSSVGFGVVYKMKGNLLLSIEPIFKYYINSFNSSESIQTHPYAFGLYSGFSLKF